MYKSKQHVTRQSLLLYLKERQIFNGSVDSLGRILKKIEFKYKKDEPRRALMELQHVASARIDFLKSYVHNLNSRKSWQPVYLDETWIFENGTVTRSWQDDSHKSVKRMKCDGKRFIMLHAGNFNGFIEGASLVFFSNSKNPDYHGEMNENNFLKWFENQLLKILEEPSLIIMDNASYHSSLSDKCPNSSWSKARIKEWLQQHIVQVNDSLLKLELLELVSRNKPAQTYKVDKLALEYGHRVLRLPQYHCIFNPIENIWGICKTYYNRYVGRDGYGQVNAVDMWKEALNHVTPEIWANTITHTDNVIKKWWDREVVFDTEDIPPLIISINNDSSTSSEDSESD